MQWLVCHIVVYHNVCRGSWDKFTYHCSHCKFDLCISCALEEELDYHSHEHPLFLYEAEKGDAQPHHLCHGCGNGILGPAYHCSQQQQCFFYLHKICAELPKEINHTLHPQHSLNLCIKPPYYSQTCECDLCQEHWDKFTYNCSYCDFNLCMSCVLGKERRIKHESHEHPLDLLQRPTLFQCDACDTKSEDISYICTVCSFRIHKGCASLQSTIKNSDHDHPLTLAYSLPNKYLKPCKICSLRVRPAHWVYYCDICNYFAHVKCATSKLEHVSLRRSKKKIKAEEDLDSNESDRESHLFHLPASPNKYVDMISEFNMKFESGKNESETEVNHFSHDHPLILSDGQSNQDAKIDEILCDGCVQPISAPFYSCAQCSFFLHKCCVELPNKVSHPLHTIHPLVLLKNDLVNFRPFRCKLCNILCNGFGFNCADCHITLDVKCASLSGSIKHKAHKHFLNPITSNDVGRWCNACGKILEGSALGCFICNPFHLCNHCAMLPPTVSHRYDPHHLYLSYPPFQDHPDEFYCEICEENMDRELWMYYCHDCDQSFHTRCVYPFDRFANINFGKALKVHNHPHVMRLVGERKRQSWCDLCGKYFVYKHIFECGPCNIIFCSRCFL